MNKLELAIGVFDSGMGGLTVLRALRNALPNESFIYLGDTARLPYGTKSPNTVQQYATQMARLLVERNIKALVIACNTATTAALTHLQTLLPDLPIIGVVEPGAMAAVAATKSNKIVVLATETTIASNAYQRLISEKIPSATISGLACSLLVALAEEGMVDNEIARTTLNHYLVNFSNQDTVLLGCTHFPVFKPLIQKILPEGVRIVDSADATASALKKLLMQENLLHVNHNPTIEYLVTDSLTRFQKVGSLFLGENLKEANLKLIDA
ncbi:glutamate racemase (plasmid) [Legionella adelaidensis]|uniref:Glutamate racemase n=1 Tax=Legionella adelaidensis TaxID=45056 RepID=A0A0W0R3E5_9GAMM|nr:glutamate racemase [Legionella adelaidensis]KTC65546.1 glutamate racemase [Legionella adelaidensis]VEH84633.1 glutamate racemase [Legionella adelaidensis]